MNRPTRNHHGRKPREKSDTMEFKDKSDNFFAEDIEKRIRFFMSSDDKELEFEPMNSYKRRLVHQVSKPFNLGSESRGEEPQRCVCLIKTQDSKVPSGSRLPRAWDFGTQSFPVKPGEEGIRLALKMDGSVEIWSEREKHKTLHDCLVTATEIRIRGGKIVQPGEQGW